MGKQNQLLLKPTELELGLQVGVEFDKRNLAFIIDFDLTSRDFLIKNNGN